MTKLYETEDLERELARPAPEPPEELLTALREDIPSDLAAAARPAPSGWGSLRRQLAAATILVGVVGLAVVGRVSYDAAQAPAAREAAVRAPTSTTLDESKEIVGPASGAARENAPEKSRSRLEDRRLEAPPGERDLDEVAADDSSGVPSAVDPAHQRAPVAMAGGEKKSVDSRQGLSQSSEIPKPVDEGRRDQAAPAMIESETTQQTAETKDKEELFRRPPAEEDVNRRTANRRMVPMPDPTPGSAATVAPPAAPAPEPEPAQTPGRSGLRALGYVAEEGRTAVPSTGGTSEPNDEPYGDMFFESAGVNPFIDTEDDRLSTFGLDVDTGSYSLARSYLDRGHLPPADAIRVEEFVNFFSYGDEPPRRGDFALTAEGAPSPFAEGPRYQVVRFGIHGREIDRADRKPAVLTFVVDVSGSMGREDRLGLVRRSLQLLLDQLYPDDRVGLVVYGGRGRVLLETTDDHEAIRQAIARLVPEGATNAEEGLVLGYELARRHFREDASNRVILCSDGVANVGRTGPDSILERIAAAANGGIELTTFGFGMGNYNDTLMERLADRGNGRYAYVDTFEEARRLFVYDLTGTLETIASDAKVQVEFNPETVSRYRLLGYENRDIADKRFRDDTVDAGEIGAGHEVTAVYEVKLTETARSRDRLARIHLRWRSHASGEVEEIGLDLRVRDLAPSWDRAAPGLRLASVVAELAEILRGSYWAREGDLEDLLRRARRLSPEFAGDPDVAELVGLIGKAARLSAQG